MQPVWARFTDYLKSLTESRGTSQRSLRFSSKKLQDEQQPKQLIEDQLYPLSNYEATRIETGSRATGMDSDVEEGRYGESTV